jgi:hypothetical protein
MKAIIEVWDDIVELPFFEVSNIGNMRSKDRTFITSAQELRRIGNGGHYPKERTLTPPFSSKDDKGLT